MHPSLKSHMCFEKPRNMLLFETHVASRRLYSAHQTPAPHAEHTSPNAIDSHHTPAFLGILGVTLRQKPALHLERGRMKTFWTNLPLTIRAAVIFCYGYAAVRILNLFAEAGTAPLTPRTLLDGALTAAVVVGALALYLGNALGAALRARREGYEPRPVGIIVAYALFVVVCTYLICRLIAYTVEAGLTWLFPPALDSVLTAVGMAVLGVINYVRLDRAYPDRRKD